MSLFIVVAAIPMGLTIVWCYCHATSSPASAFDSSSSTYYRGNRSNHRRRGRPQQQRQTQTTDSLWRPAHGNSAEEQRGMSMTGSGSSSSSEMIPTRPSVDYSMNIHEHSFEQEDDEAEGKELRLICQKNLLNSCLQIVIFLWL